MDQAALIVETVEEGDATKASLIGAIMLPEDNPLFNNLDKLISNTGLSSEKPKPEEPKLEPNQDIIILQAHAFVEETLKAIKISTSNVPYSSFYSAFINTIDSYLKTNKPLTERQLNKVWDLAVSDGALQKINKKVNTLSAAKYSFDRDWYEKRAHYAAFKR